MSSSAVYLALCQHILTPFLRATDPRLGLYVVLTYTYIMSNEHAGQWSCQATNEVGDVDTKNFTLNHISKSLVKSYQLILLQLSNELENPV